MTSQQNQSSRKGVSPDKLVSLPSLSCALSSLPQATHMGNVSLHQNMYAKRAADSEAKLQKALSKTAASFTQPQPSTPIYMNPPPRDAHSHGSPPPLMMRKPERKMHA